MGSVWRRLAARHANTLSFWAVLTLVALALLYLTSVIRQAAPPQDSPSGPVSVDARR